MDETARRLEPLWQDLAATLTTQSADTTFRELLTAYSAPDRHYHNLQHIEHMLQTIESIKSPTADLTALHIATWFHDLVYDSRKADNEERSAARAEEILTGWNAPQDFRRKIATLILATKEHQAAADDLTAQILLDADLAILSEPPARYTAYARAIRQEYAWVSDADFLSGRRKVLESFLQRDHIYFTTSMRLRESLARQNLQAELASLT
jgi:predicted metal-dependent HD superfamily phosphohydrolase